MKPCKTECISHHIFLRVIDLNTWETAIFRQVKLNYSKLIMKLQF